MNKVTNSFDYIEVTRKLIGEDISEISNSQYFFNNVRDDKDLGDIEIKTKSGLKICFKLVDDGESVGSYTGDLNIPPSFEVTKGEFCSWKKLPLNNSLEIIDCRVTSIEGMYDSHEKSKSETLSGWKVNLSNDNYFIFYNCGDEAKLTLNSIPNDAANYMTTTWKKI